MSAGKLPLDRFKQQRNQARQRGIEWQLTFDEWMGIWNESGKFHLRGKKKGQYVMARKGDSGPYSVDNVFICLFSDNIKDAYRNKPGNCGGFLSKPAPIVGRGRGWTYLKRTTKNPYQVTFRQKYIGCYPTAEIAEAAYAEALKNFRESSLSTPLNLVVT